MTMPVQPAPGLVRALAQAAAARHNTDVKSVLGRSRMPAHTQARREVILQLWGMNRYSKSSIGRALGLDHASVFHATLDPEVRARKNALHAERRRLSRLLPAEHVP